MTAARRLLAGGLVFGAAALPIPAQDARREPSFADLARSSRGERQCAGVNIDVLLAAIHERPEILPYLLAVAIEPRDPARRSLLGNQYTRLTLFQAARREYECALRLSPRFAPAHNNFGVLHLAEGNYRRAEESFRRATEINPTYALARYNLGVALDGTGRYDQALVEYVRAISLSPHLATARHHPLAARNPHRTALFLRRLLAEQAVLGSALDDSG